MTTTCEPLTGADDPRLDWDVSPEPEEVSIEGNCSAIDDETDRETEEMIRGQLDAGNEWAWCTVVVRCAFDAEDGTRFIGTSALGCCSYKSRRDFEAPDGYLPQMRQDAFDSLLVELIAAARRGEVASSLIPAEVVR